jgi:hypothetical protein
MYFDWIVYRELNPDLKKAGLLSQGQFIKHFRDCGIRENRIYNIYQAYPDFNYIEYKKNYKDLGSLTRSQLERHWIEFGKGENRIYKCKNTQTLVPKKPNLIIPKTIHKITFIIPSVGRSTLIKTIESIKIQTRSNWSCIIVFDGVNIPTNISLSTKDDKRFTIIRINKIGCLNHAARVRNEALKMVKNGWVGFVDDDDALSPYYVEHMNNYLTSNPYIKCIIFRMLYADNNVIPKPYSTNFYEGNVGISFCYSSELLSRGFYFTPSRCEDYVLLNKIQSSRYKIVMSRKIGYYVRPCVNITLAYSKSLNSIENKMSDITFN